MERFLIFAVYYKLKKSIIPIFTRIPSHLSRIYLTLFKNCFHCNIVNCCRFYTINIIHERFSWKMSPFMKSCALGNIQCYCSIGFIPGNTKYFESNLIPGRNIYSKRCWTVSVPICTRPLSADTKIDFELNLTAEQQRSQVHHRRRFLLDTNCRFAPYRTLASVHCFA